MATAVQLQPHLDDLSVRDLYASECEKIGCKKNSELLKKLPNTPGDFTSLRELDLSLNCVGKKGVRALLWVMRCATNLEKVLLADNFLTNDSIAEIVAVLHEHPAVAHVDVSRNPISHDAGKLLSEFVGTHPIITGVGVRDTLINPALVRIIEKKAAHNNALASGGVPGAAADGAPRAAAVEAKAEAPSADADATPVPEAAAAEEAAPAVCEHSEAVAEAAAEAEPERDLSASWHSISSVQMVSLIDLPTQGRRLHMDGEQFPLINLLADNAQELGALWTDRQRRRAQSAADAPLAEWWALELVTSLDDDAAALRHVSLATAQPDGADAAAAAAASDGFPLLHSLNSSHGAQRDSALASLVAATALRGAAALPPPPPAKVELRNLTVLFETAAVTAGDMSGLEYLRHSLEVMHAKRVAEAEAAEEGQSRSESDDGAPATPENLSESGELLRRDDKESGGGGGDGGGASSVAAADAEVNAGCEEEEAAEEDNLAGGPDEVPPSPLDPHTGEWYAMDLIWTIASSKIESAEADADADWSGLASVMSVINNDASPTCPPSS